MQTRTLLALIDEAHEGQVDRAGKRYVLHPFSVALQIRRKVAKLALFRHVSEDTLLLAEKACLAHDLLEDTDVTAAELLAKGLEPVVVEALDHLTKQEEEDYETFVTRAQQSLISHMAKIADIIDNLDPSRIAAGQWSAADEARAAKYKRALRTLGVREDEMDMVLAYF